MTVSDWLLAESLSRLVVEACDGQSVRLRCPRGTTVSVRSANYEPDETAACSSSAASDSGSNPPPAAGLEDDVIRSSAVRPPTLSAAAGAGAEHQLQRRRRDATYTNHDRGQRSATTLIKNTCSTVDSLEVEKCSMFSPALHSFLYQFYFLSAFFQLIVDSLVFFC